MQSDRLRQRKKANEKSVSRRPPLEGRGNRQQGEDLSLPIFRSPALESAKLQKVQAKPAHESSRTPQRRFASTRRVAKVMSAEDRLDTVPPRKSLPYLRSRVSNASLPAVFPSGVPQMVATRRVSRPLQNEQRLHSGSSFVQAISEEEEKKLAELEMQLPRVAGKMDSMLLVVVLALLCIGLVMVYSASAFVAVSDYNDASYFFQKQLLGAVLGLAAMLVTIRVDYRQWRRFSTLGLVIVFPLLVIVLKFGTTAYGASRWLTFGSFWSFQPSELAKLVLALYIADWLARKGNQVGTFLYGLAPFVILVGAVLGLVLLENDLGTAVVIAGLAAAMFFTAGADALQFGLSIGCGCLIFITQAFRGYRYYRLLGFLNPFSNITGYNLQLYQSLLALGSGGWLGLGLGASRQKTGYLPLPHIDSIFAIIGEELGFIGCTIVILLFMLLAFRGFRLARRAQDVYGAILATGITTWLVLQMVVNVGSTTAAIPYTGVPLPFISYGGSSLVVSMAAVGILLSISRYIQEPEDPAFSRYSITKTIKRRRAR
jgi:cell division protein FtsW